MFTPARGSTDAKDKDRPRTPPPPTGFPDRLHAVNRAAALLAVCKRLIETKVRGYGTQ